MKYVIGLTGNIGTGKSTVLKMLEHLGATVIDADVVTREVMRPEGSAHQRIVDAFGPEILNDHEEIDRAALGKRVFSNPMALRSLEQIVHPATIEHITQRIDDAQSEVVVVEAIKLIESGMVTRLCRALWVVTASEEQQIARLMANREMSRAEALQRVRAQTPQSAKVAVADVVIDNSGSIESTKRQVEDAWSRIPVEFRTWQPGHGDEERRP